MSSIPSSCHLPSCGETSGLKACASCQAVAYCCREHQVEDWKKHKKPCKKATKLRKIKSDPLYEAKKKGTALLDWLKTKGAKFPKIEFKYFSADNRGVFATKDIKKRERVLELPLASMLTQAELRKNKLFDALCNRCPEFSSEQSFFALYLALERHKKKAPFRAFIDILPKHIEGLPVCYSQEEIKLLDGSLAQGEVEQHYDDDETDWNEVKKLSPAIAKAVAYEDFQWGTKVVMSRLFGYDRGEQKNLSSLVPLGDMINHQVPREKNCRWTFSSKEDKFLFIAVKDIPKGTEVFTSYGDKCVSEYVLHYGFSSYHPDENSCQIRPVLPQTDPCYSAKASLIKRANDEFDAKDPDGFNIHMSFTWTDKNTIEGFSILRFINSTPAEFVALFPKRVYSSAPNKLTATKIKHPLNFRNEIAMLHHLQAEMHKSLAKFPTTIYEDEHLLQGDELSYNARNAIVLRQSEKLVIDQFLYFIDLFLTILEPERQVADIKKELTSMLTKTPIYSPDASLLPPSSNKVTPLSFVMAQIIADQKRDSKTEVIGKRGRDGLIKNEIMRQPYSRLIRHYSRGVLLPLVDAALTASRGDAKLTLGAVIAMHVAVRISDSVSPLALVDQSDESDEDNTDIDADSYESQPTSEDDEDDKNDYKDIQHILE